MKLYWIIILFICSCSRDNNTSSEIEGENQSYFETVEHTIPSQVNVNLLDGLKKYATADSSLQLYKELDLRLPYLIYYAVDSIKEEPYLKASIDYEIKTLVDSCNGKKHVNWMIVRNTDIVKFQSIQICFQGTLRTKKISHILNGMKQYNVDFFANNQETTNDITDSSDSGLKTCKKDENGEVCFPHKKMTRNNELKEILVELGMKNETKTLEEVDLVEIYNSFPVVNPYFFKNILDASINLTPFTENFYAKFLHVKSHGHIDYALTGLLDYQIDAKIKHQTEKLKIQNPEKMGLTGQVPGQENIIVESTERIFTNIKTFDKYSIGYSGSSGSETANLNNDSNDNSSDKSKPKDANFSLSPTDTCSLKENNSQNLGVDTNDGLGTGNIYLGNHIGLTPDSFLSLLSGTENINKFDSKQFSDTLTNKPQYRFILVESCDSSVGGTRWPVKSNYINDKLSAMYSSDGALWFRNIDYNLIFNALEKNEIPYTHSSMMQQLFIDVTKTIKVKIPKNKSEHEIFVNKYDKIIEKLGKR